MPILAGISMFMFGRHNVGGSRFADDEDETRIVAVQVVLDDEGLAMWPGDWREDNIDGMDEAARECLKINGRMPQSYFEKNFSKQPHSKYYFALEAFLFT
ncbi:hypothetical protein [Methylobacterium sp. A52T]